MDWIDIYLRYEHELQLMMKDFKDGDSYQESGGAWRWPAWDKLQTSFVSRCEEMWRDRQEA